ncbi:hypothetical protein K438DRAFT_1971855 [Mycena galopus ATCC 62051]|nr:hypothetical protein K438DRAFT_1971855 [Mycena galopus ATCC 62051]
MPPTFPPAHARAAALPPHPQHLMCLPAPRLFLSHAAPLLLPVCVRAAAVPPHPQYQICPHPPPLPAPPTPSWRRAQAGVALPTFRKSGPPPLRAQMRPHPSLTPFWASHAIGTACTPGPPFSSSAP